MTRLFLLAYVVLMSLLAFAAFGLDKYKAKTNRWQTRERTLFLFALLGGGIGAFLGMKVFHHKTLHKQFAIGIPAIMIVQLLIFGYLWVKL